MSATKTTTYGGRPGRSTSTSGRPPTSDPRYELIQFWKTLPSAPCNYCGSQNKWLFRSAAEAAFASNRYFGHHGEPTNSSLKTCPRMPDQPWVRPTQNPGQKRLFDPESMSFWPAYYRLVWPWFRVYSLTTKWVCQPRNPPRGQVWTKIFYSMTLGFPITQWYWPSVVITPSYIALGGWDLTWKKFPRVLYPYGSCTHMGPVPIWGHTAPETESERNKPY